MASYLLANPTAERPDVNWSDPFTLVNLTYIRRLITLKSGNPFKKFTKSYRQKGKSRAQRTDHTFYSQLKIVRRASLQSTIIKTEFGARIHLPLGVSWCEIFVFVSYLFWSLRISPHHGKWKKSRTNSRRAVNKSLIWALCELMSS